jgi:hypothetical protein
MSQRNFRLRPREWEPASKKRQGTKSWEVGRLAASAMGI